MPKKDDLSDWGDPEKEDKGRTDSWHITKEKILMGAGLVILGYIMVVSPLLHQDFHYEWLILGGALCGISVAQWGDKK